MFNRFSVVGIITVLSSAGWCCCRAGLENNESAHCSRFRGLSATANASAQSMADRNGWLYPSLAVCLSGFSGSVEPLSMAEPRRVESTGVAPVIA